MREGWKEITIGDLGQVITGNTPPRKQPDLYGKHTIFVKPTDMEVDKKYCYNPEEYYSEKGFIKYKKSLIPKGSTCVVTIGSIGQKMIKAHTELFINQAVNAIVPNNYYDEDFVYYLLKINLFQLKTFDSGTASGRENVSKSSFSNIKLIVPKSKRTQSKIASILSSFDDLIENNLKRIKLLEEKAQLTYEEWFVKMRFPGYKTAEFDKITNLPKGWEFKRSDTLFNIKIGKTPPREETEWFNKQGTGYKWASIKDINNASSFIFETSENISIEGVRKFNMNVAKKDTVILSFKLTVGKITIVTEDFVTNEAIAHFNQLANTKYSRSFIYCYLKGFNYDSLGSTSSIGTAINSKIVKAIPFLVPTDQILINFQNQIDPIFDILKNLTIQNRLLKDARDILLPRLMSGMIDVEELELESSKK